MLRFETDNGKLLTPQQAAFRLGDWLSPRPVWITPDNSAEIPDDPMDDIEDATAENWRIVIHVLSSHHDQAGVVYVLAVRDDSYEMAYLHDSLKMLDKICIYIGDFAAKAGISFCMTGYHAGAMVLRSKKMPSWVDFFTGMQNIKLYPQDPQQVADEI